MLPIRVLGSGLIPRGHGLAPKKKPFPADLNLIALIISMGGMTPEFVDPETKKVEKLTRSNYRKVYDKYQEKLASVKKQVDPSQVVGTQEQENVDPKTINTSQPTNITTSIMGIKQELGVQTSGLPTSYHNNPPFSAPVTDTTIQPVVPDAVEDNKDESTGTTDTPDHTKEDDKIEDTSGEPTDIAPESTGEFVMNPQLKNNNHHKNNHHNRNNGNR